MQVIVRLALLVLLLGGCASQPVPRPSDPQSSALGVELKVRVSGLVTYRADTIFFIRACDGAGIGCEQPLIGSSYARDGRIYLLNAPPGDYRAVAAMFYSGTPGDKSLYFAYFPEALSTATRVRLRPGTLAYAGSYVLATTYGVCPQTAEPDQLRYAELIEPGTAKCGLLASMLGKLSRGDYLFIGGTAYPLNGQTFHYRGGSFTKQPEPAGERAFREAARGDLGGAGWALD